jgi:hypothetical protein
MIFLYKFLLDIYLFLSVNKTRFCFIFSLTVNNSISSPLSSETDKQLDIDSYVGGSITLNSRYYSEKGDQVSSQYRQAVEIAPIYSLKTNNNNSEINIEPIIRYDQQDSNGSYLDLVEFNWRHVTGSTEFIAGFTKIFWGVTESQHLVDVINQTSFSSSNDGEDKLGQPLIGIKLEEDFGYLDFYLLTGFRERIFPGEDGRVRGDLIIDEDGAIYESGAENKRIDVAIRWGDSFNDLDIALSHFIGTNREPLFVSNVQENSLSQPSVIPFYNVISQTGLELQFNAGDIIYKFEGFSRENKDSDFSAYTAGIEQSFYRVFGSQSDVNLIFEYLYDERGDDAPLGVFERDVFIGARFLFNDLSNTVILPGLFWNTRTNERIFRLEGETRLSASWGLSVTANIFTPGENKEGSNVSSNFIVQSTEPIFFNDDYIEFHLERYF